MKLKYFRGGEGEVAQIMYTHVSKCKNDKTKFKTNSTPPKMRTLMAMIIIITVMVMGHECIWGTVGGAAGRREGKDTEG
jgi:hypothetical protein